MMNIQNISLPYQNTGVTEIQPAAHHDDHADVFKHLLYGGKNNINELSLTSPQDMLMAQAFTTRVVSSVSLTSKVAGEVSQCVNKLTGMQ